MADLDAPVWRFYHGRTWPPDPAIGCSEDVGGLTWWQARSRAEMALGPMLDEDDCEHCLAQAKEAALVLERLAPGEAYHEVVDGADLVIVAEAGRG